MASTADQARLEELIRQADLEGAKKLASTILSSTGDDPDALSAKARVSAAMGDRDAALKALERALKASPDHVDALTYKAALLLDARGRDDEAAALLERALQGSPEHAPARFNRGRLKARRGDFKAAIVDVDRALAHDPENPFYMFARARLDVDTGDVEASFAKLVKTVKLAPELVEAWLVLVGMQMQAGRHADAKKNLETALTHSPGDLALLDALANACLATGDLDGATRAATAVVEGLPENAGARVNLAVCLIAKGQHQEAEDHLRRALRLDAKDPRALHTLGTLLEATDDDDAVDEARFLFEEALEVAPDFWKARSDLGLLHTVHERHKDLAKAKALLVRALELSGGRPEPLFNLALCEAKLGEHEQALARLAQVEAHALASPPVKEQAKGLAEAIRNG